MEQGNFNRLKHKVDELAAVKQYKKALGLLVSHLEKDPGNPHIYLLLGDVSQNVDKTEAIAYYKKGIELSPKNPYLNIGLGFLYFNLKDFANAERYLLNIWVEDPTNIRLLTALGKIYKSWKLYEKAMKYFHICELLEPKNSFAVYGLADTYRGLGNNDNALKYWLKFHELEPHNKVALTRIGDCYSKLGDTDTALNFYLKALEIGYDFYAYIGAAKLYLSKNKVGDALEIFEKLSAGERNNSRYFYEYIHFCLKAGMKEKALELWSTASQFFPGNLYIESFNSKMLE